MQDSRTCLEIEIHPRSPEGMILSPSLSRRLDFDTGDSRIMFAVHRSVVRTSFICAALLSGIFKGID